MIVGANGPHYTTDTRRWNERDLPLFNDINIKHIRLGIGITQEYVDRALAAGFKVIATLNTTGLPDEGLFTQYVINHVSQYAGKVEGWVVFNEVNKWNGSWDFPPSEYIKALKAAHVGIKTADPSALTITSNFMYADRAAQYMQELYSLDPTIMAQYDVVAVDPYCYPAPPEKPNVDQFGHGFWELQSLVNVMANNGDNTPLWIVEMGWPTFPCSTPDSRAVDEVTQADYILRSLKMSKQFGVKRFYVYKWMTSTGEHCMGLIPTQYEAQPDGTWLVKPSYFAVKNFIKGVTAYYLTINSTAYGTTDPLPGVYQYNENQIVSVTAIPDPNYLFDYWVLNGENYLENPISINMTASISLTPNFVAAPPPPPDKKILSIIAGVGGTTEPEPLIYEYDENTQITITALPKSGYKFKNWVFDGVEYVQNPLPILMDSNHSLYAAFESTTKIGVLPIIIVAGIAYLMKKK